MFTLVTPFPFLLDFSFYAPVLLRIAVGMYLFSWVLSNKEKAASATPVSTQDYSLVVAKILAVIAGLSLIIGLYVQIGALITIALLVAALAHKDIAQASKLSRGELTLLLIITIALLVTGAGPFAIDLPL